MTTDTKERILDAAERLFAAHGFGETSMRALTAAAGVNLAAANYHFGSKDGVLRAILLRRLEPINAARLAELDRVEAACQGAPPDLEAVLAAFVEPALGVARSPEGRPFVQLLGRVHADPDHERIKEMLFELYAPVRDRFVPALAAAVPELPFEEICWRFLFLVGAMAHTMTCVDDLRWLSGGRVQQHDARTAATRLIAFTAAGFRAGATTEVPR